jgi:cysteine desulfurase
MRIYFDNAATTPMRKEVIDAMLPYLREYFGNPSSIHAEGRKARTAVEAARKIVARTIGASIGEIFFTSGGTESNNMALKCAVRDLGVKRIITSPVEHHNVFNPLNRLVAENKVVVVNLNVDGYGRPDMEELQRELGNSDLKTMVSIMHGNNEVGTMIDLEQVSEMCAEAGALFHSDTVQTVGHFPIDVNETKISFMAGAGHKIHGPKGVGFIYINGDNMIEPYLDGGSQERNMRAGTENVPGIVGFAEALRLMTENLEEEVAHIENLKLRMRQGLEGLIPGISFNGDPEGPSLYTVLNVSFPPSPRNEVLLLSLDIAGISASGGSACSSGAETRSHVLKAMNADSARKAIRFSFSMYNTTAEVDMVLGEIKKLFPVASVVES